MTWEGATECAIEFTLDTVRVFLNVECSVQLVGQEGHRGVLLSVDTRASPEIPIDISKPNAGLRSALGTIATTGDPTTQGLHDLIAPLSIRQAAFKEGQHVEKLFTVPRLTSDPIRGLL